MAAGPAAFGLLTHRRGGADAGPQRADRPPRHPAGRVDGGQTGPPFPDQRRSPGSVPPAPAPAAAQPPRPLLTLVPRSAESPGLVLLPAAERTRLAGLPAPLTRFIGRGRETAEVAALLRRDDVRLVTLTGPGGVGKTRLALQAAAGLVPDLADGAAFVPLAPVRSAELVLATIALALGARDGDDRPALDRLRAFLRDREALLVLDNFEQVLAAGPLLVDLLASCPHLTMLVTSRAPLRVSGERIVSVPPLELPARQTGQDDAALSELAASEAVQLFVDRAQAAAADFRLRPDNAAAVAAICARADGLPLAIELAAARTALLSPEALLARLQRRLPLLSDGPRDQPDRLRTMRDAIAWSHDLLTADERACYRRLAVFVGGCTIDGAEWVATESGVGSRESDVGRQTKDGEAAIPGVGATQASPDTPHTLSPHHPIPTSDTLDLVQRLVDQAVLQRLGEATDEPRFGMLETIREYGLEQLAASGEETAVRDAHAAWCVALAERAEPELAGPEQAIWVRRLETELGNIRAAHQWLAARGDAESSLRLAGAIGWFWSSAPYFDEARALFDSMLAMPGAAQAPAALAKVLASAGDVADWQGDQPRARAFYERALAIYRALDDRGQTASMLRGLGSSAIDRGEIDLAIALLEESLSLANAVDNAWEAAAATNLLGTVASMRGDFLGALARHEDAADGWRELGDFGHVVTALTSGGWAALLAREPHRAAMVYQEALRLAADADDSWYVAWCVIGAGALAATQGDHRLAAELFAIGTQERERIGILLRPQTQESLTQVMAAVRARLGEREFAAAWQRGPGIANGDGDRAGVRRLRRRRAGRPDPLRIDPARARRPAAADRRAIGQGDRRRPVRLPPHRLQTRRRDPGQARRQLPRRGGGHRFAPRAGLRYSSFDSASHGPTPTAFFIGMMKRIARFMSVAVPGGRPRTSPCRLNRPRSNLLRFDYGRSDRSWWSRTPRRRCQLTACPGH